MKRGNEWELEGRKGAEEEERTEERKEGRRRNWSKVDL